MELLVGTTQLPREVLSWIWNHGLLVHGNFNIWISQIVSKSVQFQSNLISIISILLLARVPPHSVILSDQLVEMLSVESEHSFYYITIPCRLESSDHVHTEASVHAIDLDQCQTDHPNLMAHLVLSTSLSNNIYIARVGFSLLQNSFPCDSVHEVAQSPKIW